MPRLWRVMRNARQIRPVRWTRNGFETVEVGAHADEPMTGVCTGSTAPTERFQWGGPRCASYTFDVLSYDRGVDLCGVVEG
jgi:hypothetical protein